jgi:hypothetical protein
MIRRSLTFAVCVLLVSTSCDVDSVTSDASPDPGADGSGGGGDAAPAGGLTFDFRSKPKLPPHGDGEAGGPWDAEIDAAMIVLRDVRAIGDAAPGSGETTADMLTLTWLADDKELLVFSDAPPGIYSLLRAQIVSWDVTGTVDVEGEDEVAFHITDTPSMSLSVTVPMNVTLAANDDETVRIDIELEDVIRDIDWDDAPEDDDDTLLINASYSEIDDVRDNLSEAFELHD